MQPSESCSPARRSDRCRAASAGAGSRVLPLHLSRRGRRADRFVAAYRHAFPGHTLESMSYRLDDAALFTGDTLFLAGVGRPDLEASPGACPAAGSPAARVPGAADCLPETIILPGHERTRPLMGSRSVPRLPRSSAGSRCWALRRTPSWRRSWRASRPPRRTTPRSWRSTKLAPCRRATHRPRGGANRCAVS